MNAGPALLWDDVHKSFDGSKAVDGVSLEVHRGEFAAITGHSGSGKTTLLRMAAGLLRPDKGRVVLGGDAGAGQPVLVFQDYLLFPHLRVVDNVSFAPRAKGLGAAASRRIALDLLEQLGLGDKARAWPGELSGGQQQRVAIARALASEAPVLLLDEPLANLDRSLRMETARFLRALQKERGLTMVMVTHGQEEAFAVADRIAYMRKGSLVQYGTAQEFRNKPADPETAAFMGEINCIRSADSGAELWFRASDTDWDTDESGDAVLEEARWTGSLWHLSCRWRGQPILVQTTRIPPAAGTQLRLKPRPLTFHHSTKESP